MKRKPVILILTLALLLTLFSACDKIEDQDTVSGESSTSEPAASDEAQTTATTAVSTEASTTTAATTPVTSDHTVPIAPIDTENSIVQTAQALIGIPFAENGTSPSEGFDNSGFIYYVLRENGFINCPRLTYEQAAMGINIGYDQLKSGDLAFFCTDGSGNPDFGGIYIGEGQMIYCPMPGQTVKVTDITSDYWRNAFVTGVSLS